MSSYLNIVGMSIVPLKNMVIEKQCISIILNCLYYAYQLLTPKCNAIFFNCKQKIVISINCLFLSSNLPQNFFHNYSLGLLRLIYLL